MHITLCSVQQLLHSVTITPIAPLQAPQSIEDSFEYTQRSNEFEQIHNTPEKIMKYAGTLVAEIEKKERLLSKSRGNPNSWSSWMKTLFVQSHSSTIQCCILLLILHYIIHELHPSDVKVIFDLDHGDCHPLHHESNYVLIVYCKRSDEEENNHYVHYLLL